MKKRTITNTWAYAACFALALLLVTSIIYGGTISDSYASSDVRKSAAGAISFVAFFSLIISIIAIFKTKTWVRLVPILGVIISLVMLSLALFAYSFSGYGSPN